MPSSRRHFIQRSATAAAAIGLAPLTNELSAERLTAIIGESPDAIRAYESRLVRAHPVPLDKVRLTGGPLKQVQDVTRKYLLSLDPDRMMAFYRVRAGLAQKAQPYEGWDGGGRNLTGHIAGHHLSAVSLMYVATGDPAFKQRADYLVREMKEVQDKNGDGYLGALENGREAFAAVSKGEIRSGGFDLNGLWSPWYTLHKTYAGLRDAYRYTGNKTALAVETKYAGWAAHVVAPLTDEQFQKMLLTEHGGMNEVLADLYADTGDKRWLDLSYRFEHHAFTDSLKRHQDNLDGKHGNCQIPKLIGSAARYGYVGDPEDIMAASFFWDRVTQHHSYATAGHGLSEYFGPPDQLSTRVDGRTCESCNVYNMLKLTRRLFSFRPDPFYADFQERALFNHALASIDPSDGTTSYMVPVGRGVQQEYQDMQRSFTCCVGTGMENQALHGYGVYYESPDTVWVTQFVPSEAQLTLGHLKIAQETSFPDGDSAALTLTLPSPKEFTLAVRRPYWAGDAFTIKVNGTNVAVPTVASLRPGAAGGRLTTEVESLPQSSSFVEIKRIWNSGDKVELTIPKSLHLEPTPDNKRVAAIMWGPLTLAGDLGARREGRSGPAVVIPVLLIGDRPVTEWVTPAGAPGDFRVEQVGRAIDNPSTPVPVSLTPFYRTHRRTYSIYFDVLSQADLDARIAAAAAERERIRQMELATVAFLQFGDATLERTYNYQSEPADRQSQRMNGRASRGGPGWFSYDMPIDPATPMSLVVTYFNELGLPPVRGDFQLVVDGTPIATFQPNGAASGFFDARYAIPAELTRGKTKATVKFQAAPNGRIAPVFGLRMVRGSAG
jgi:uncharacterized protein